MKIVTLLSILFFAGCVTPQPEPEEDNPERKSQSDIWSPSDSTGERGLMMRNVKAPSDSQAKVGVRKFHEHLFITNSQGIEYWNEPDGERLGHFKLNQHLRILSKPFYPDTVLHAQIETVTWYGVALLKDTVYVLSEYLSNEPVYADVALHYVDMLYDDDEKFQTYFINLSEKFPYNYESSDPVVMKKSNFEKTVVRLSQAQKDLLLSKTGIRQNDTVYLFDFLADTVLKIPVSATSAIANLNIYARGSQSAYSSYSPEIDYELGLALDDGEGLSSDMFACIASTSPFKTGGIAQMKWEAIEKEEMPVAFDPSLVDPRMQTWFDGIETGAVHRFSNDIYHYFIQDLMRGQRVNYRYLVVLDTASNQPIHHTVFMDTESTSLVPLSTLANSEEGFQWTGTLFKHKPPVLYGFESNTFGCTMIDFISDTLPSIPILCDNRH